VSEDPLNCGGCGVACPAGQLCLASACHALEGAGGSGSGGAATGGGTASGGAVGSGGLGSGGLGSGGQGSGGLASGGQGSGGVLSSGGATGSGGGPSDCTATGFYVAGGMLYDANCNEFIMRGVNYPYAWYMSRDTQADLNAIAATGANAVRIVMATGDRWDKTSAAQLTNLITWAKAAQMIAVLEVHDVTGYAEQAESVPLSSAQAYWTGSDITDVLMGEEAYVIVNIGNEPNGNDTSEDDWSGTHVTAVQALRAAGLHHTLVVDGPNWGQDWQNFMRDDFEGRGSAIWNADAEKNLVFSVHMYQEFSADSDVTTFYNNFLEKYAAPLIVGEFAADHGDAGGVAEGAIMTFAESLGIGYLGWSWSGNGSGLESLDITQNFDAASLSAWGDTLVHGPSGLQETSEVCSIFQ
jgi:mannan endo-1,4-beta-mannosidase